MGDELGKLRNLSLAMRFAQAQVHVDHVQRCRIVWQLDHRMQQSACFMSGDRYIVVAVAGDREPRQHGIALVAFGQVRVSTVGVVGPQRPRQVCVLRFLRPLRVATRMACVRAEDFLQQDDIRADVVDRIAERGQQEPPPRQVEAGVDVEAEDGDPRHGRSMRSRQCGHGGVSRAQPSG